MDKDTEAVQVALRIRPQNAREQVDMCRICTFVTPGEPQIVLGKDKAFTFDHVFDVGTEQLEIYNACVEKLVEGCFDGFNATVLAYGQTGSGKTYTMGTGFDVAVLPEEQGMIPRAVHHLFLGIATRREQALAVELPVPQFEVTAQFLELYNEEIIDLFDANREQGRKLKIHETLEGSIYVDGATSQKVTSEEETLMSLKQGALSRSVGSTNMNAQSSRSHAIFTLTVQQQRPVLQPIENGPSSRNEVADWETLSAKFHFVDLAGSERLKRTGATGERAKEGISINSGLLALGNVISALGDRTKRGTHVPYRDSKLTRLLQDSLGGNSRTLMIACISPTDRDFMETLNSLKYANRARNIKNKVVVNQDKASAQLAAMRKRVQELELELHEFRSGRMMASEDGGVVFNDLATENTMLKTENDKLRLRIKTIQQVVDGQAERLAYLQAVREAHNLRHQDESTGQVMGGSGEDAQLQEMLQDYIRQIEDLRSQLFLSESHRQQQQQQAISTRGRLLTSTTSMTNLLSSSHGPRPLTSQQSVVGKPFEEETMEIIETARGNIERLQGKHKSKVSVPTKEHKKRRYASNSPERMSVAATESHTLKRDNTGDSLLTQNDNGDDEDDDDSDTEVPADDDEDDEDDETSDLEVASVSSSSDSDIDVEDFDDAASITTSIAELTSEINIKQQLVEQLEKAQRNLHSLRQQYEEKMMVLQQQIRTIENDRDKAIKEMVHNRATEQREEKIREIKSEYEKQLSDLKRDLKQLQLAKREHAKALKKNAQQEAELRRMKSDLTDMKKQKVRLVRQMKEELAQQKILDRKKEREITQLRKDFRKKDHMIRALQADAKRKDMVLKRKQDEVSALRRQRFGHSRQATAAKTKKNVPSVPSEFPPGVASAMAAALTTTVAVVRRNGPARNQRLKRRLSSVFSSEGARQKWRNMEKMVGEVINRCQTLNSFEKDMDSWVQKREDLSHRADELKQQREALLQATEDVDMLSSIDEEHEAIVAQISWANECIENLQEEVVAFEDTKTDNGSTDLMAMVHSCTVREAKYLLEHLITLSLEMGTQAKQRESEVKCLRLRLNASEQHAELIRIYSSPLVPQSPLVVNSRTVTKISSARHSQASTLTVPLLSLDDDKLPSGSEGANDGGRGFHNSDLDNQMPTIGSRNETSLQTSNSIQVSEASKGQLVQKKYRRRTAVPSELRLGHQRRLSDPPSPSVFDHQHEHTDNGSQSAVNIVTSREMVSEAVELKVQVSSRTRNNSGEQARQPKKSRSATQVSLEVPTEPMVLERTCPSSPVAAGGKTRVESASVFTRLSSVQENTSSDSKGQFEAERIPAKGGRQLVCTHTARGHTGSVLSVFATDILLLSASQDCTVKIWDLSSGKEVSALGKHHSYVRKVTYSPDDRLVFTACQSVIKVWDIRDLRRCHYLQKISPPGGSAVSSSDTVVQDMLVSDSNLLSAAGNTVSVWDMRKFSLIGRLVGHSGTVGTMAILTKGLLATGSRDRLVKFYDTSGYEDAESGFSQTSPVYTLMPPHYDAVSALAVCGRSLYSACGVTIKLWDVKRHTLELAMDGAHSQGKSNVITSLALLDHASLLISACKSGVLKLWAADNCHTIGEVPAHKMSINSLAVNSDTIFTGSSDKTVKVWRPTVSC